MRSYKNLEKSDSAIVAEKQMNKGQLCLAESVEPRAEAEGNLEAQSRCHAQKWVSQSQVADRIRQASIFKEEFLGFSYGFRPERGMHDALDALMVGIQRRKVGWIVDVDIKAFFDTLDRDWLIRFLEHRIGDVRLVRLTIKWLNAGVMDGIEWKETERGVPHGAIVSPILANLYLHYVFDLWVNNLWCRRKAKGDLIVVRYADDFVVGFQYRREAEPFLST